MASLAPSVASVPATAASKRAMPQSLSAVERGNPPPRRKSCAGCISAKRRCDLVQPSCARCTQRSMPCKYPPGVPAAAGARARAPHRQPTQGAGSAEAAPTPLQMELPLSFSLDMIEDMATPANSASMFTTTYGDASGLLVPDLNIGRTIGNNNSNNVSLFDDPMLDITHASLASNSPSTPSTVELPQQPQENEAFWNDVLNSITQPTKDMFPAAIQVNPWEPIRPSTALVPLSTQLTSQICGGALPAWPESVAAIFASRLKYILETCSNSPTSIVLENSTPWSHQALWASSAGMPRTMQDAQACCALHMARTPVNTDVINRNLDSRALDLMLTPMPFSRERSQQSSSLVGPESPPLVEQLAHTQALLLHLLMRMNDTAPLAEKIGEALEDSTTALLQAMQADTSTARAPGPDTVLPLYPLAPARDAWRAWVVAESVRRTALISFVVRQIFSLQRGRTMPCGDETFRMFQFSCPASLWAANDAVTFALAWRAASGDAATGSRDKRKVVNIMQLQSAMESGEPDDFDLLGKMSLTAVFGIDEVKGWYASKGAVF